MVATLLSDAHLDRRDDVQARFVALVDGLPAGPLVLCGDVFDAWWGFADRIPESVRPAIDALARARSRGVPVVWVRGNRDFHAGPYIEDTLGIEVVDEWHGTIGARRVLAVHGDQCDTRRRQRLFTSLLRGPLPRALARLLGPKRTWAAAARIGSRRGTSHPGLLDAQRAWADAHLGEIDVVVMGHSHVPLVESRARGAFVNLGSFAHDGTWGVIDEHGARLEGTR